MRVLRIYHAGRDTTHRARDRALVAAGAEVTLVVPSAWPEADSLHDEPFEVVPLPVRRPGDVNRHTYRSRTALTAVIARVRPDVVDLHEEPFSSVTHQLLAVLDRRQAVVGYSAQNLDKRFPPPFHTWERAALARWRGAYPCSRQAASVLRGKGLRAPIEVLPLGVSGSAPHRASGGLAIGFVGRLVPEKGGVDAVRAVAAVRRSRTDARLVVAGRGPDEARLRATATDLRVPIEWHGPLGPQPLSSVYAGLDVLVVPSHTTRTWAEQFGRVVIEAAAHGAAVVGYASGALPEVIGAVGGTVVPEGDVPALVAAVLAARPHAGPVVGWDEIAQRQLALYERAAHGERSQPTGRRAARREFGPPAGADRPFALPGLREDTSFARHLAAVLDAVGRG